MERKKTSPIPRLLMMAFAACCLGWLVIQNPGLFQTKELYGFGVWAFGFTCGGLVTSIILKW